MDVANFLKSKEAKNYKAIIKTLTDGRRMLVGFERRKKSSRHYAQKLLLNPPAILDELLAAHKETLAQLNATESQPIPTPASPA